MSRSVFLSALLALLLVVPTQASAKILARIDLSQQRLHLFVNGARAYSWPVSTARRGYRTPLGSFRPQRLHRRYYSRKYHGSPMPYSVFFYGGYAIHGTTYLRSLGRPASHGCIRLHPRNAAVFFSLIQRHGRGNTRIVISR
ncbi:MAG: L,D-transpeptidase [Methyloligellaceae bacterium]